MRIAMILSILLASACLFADAADWAGRWRDNQLSVTFTIELTDGAPNVIVARDGAKMMRVGSSWFGDYLQWNFYHDEYGVAFVYMSEAIDDLGLRVSWENSRADYGQRTLTRVETDPDELWSGVWKDPSNGLTITVKARDGAPILREVTDGQGQAYEIIGSEFANHQPLWRAIDVSGSEIVFTGLQVDDLHMRIERRFGDDTEMLQLDRLQYDEENDSWEGE